jgi:hypothetical protein
VRQAAINVTTEANDSHCNDTKYNNDDDGSGDYNHDDDNDESRDFRCGCEAARFRFRIRFRLQNRIRVLSCRLHLQSEALDLQKDRRLRTSRLAAERC